MSTQPARRVWAPDPSPHPAAEGSWEQLMSGSRWRYGAGVASGALMALSFPHPGWWPLAWFALVPLFLALRGLPPSRAAGVSLAFGLSFYGLLLTWLNRLGLPAYLTVVAVSAAYSALFGVFASSASRGAGDGRFFLVACLAWVTVEWLRGLGTASFPWGLAGYSQWTNLPILQLASLGGVYLVSAAVVVANAGFALLLLRRPAGILPVLLVAVAWGWGTWRVDRVRVETQPRVPVGAVQPNLVQQRKLDPDYAPHTRETLTELTREAVLGGARLVVWPEHYWPDPLLTDGQLDPRLGRAIPEGVALLATGEIDGRRNSAVVVERGRVVGRHDKVRLVPLGEWWAEPGPGYEPVAAPGGPAGILLCYEIVYPQAARSLVLRGARYLVHSTEEGWFGESAGPVQHLGFAVVRAVELGRDVVRAASIGISGIVDRTGRLQAHLSQGTRGWVGGRIEPRSDLTPYARWGDVWVWVAAGILGALSLPVLLRWLSHDLLLAVLVPGVVAVAGRLTGLGPYASGMLLAAASLAVHPDAGRVGLVRARHPASVVGAVGFAGAAVWLVQVGFAAQGIPLSVQLPDAWQVLPHLVAGVGQEVWLRGVIPSVLAPYPVAAFALSELGTFLLHAGARGEVVAWHLLSGAVFFVVRRLSGSVWGPVLARGVGDAALASLLRL